MGTTASQCGWCGPPPAGVEPVNDGTFSREFADKESLQQAPAEPEAEPLEADQPLARRSDKKLVTKTKAEMDKIKAMQARGQRAGVCAEVVSQQSVKDFKKPVYPKTPAEEAKLRKIIAENEKMKVLVGHLNEASLQDVINALFAKEVKQGQDVIKQGDEGDCLYICEEGDLDIFVARTGAQPGDRGTKVLSVGAGALFGELALMYTAPRAATISVTSASARLWALEREAFKILLTQTSQQQFQLYEGWLSEVDILKHFNKYELSQIADLMESTLFDTDEIIIRQGDPGESFFIVEDGTCAAFIAGAGGEKEVKSYSQGEYFGEIALLTDAPRKATVRATGEGCTVLSVSKEDFTNALGPIQDILKQNIDKYPTYAEFVK